MNRLKKIFKRFEGEVLEHDINVIFLSEGFLANKKSEFHNACKKCIDEIKKFSPFNLMELFPGINFFSHFIASNIEGVPNLGVGQGNETVFGAELDLAGKTITFNIQRIKEAVDGLYFVGKEGQVQLNSILIPGNVPDEFSCTIVCILCNILDDDLKGISYEYIPGKNEYYFCATGLGGNWEQVLLRTFGRVFNLGNEQELISDVEGEDSLIDDNEILHLFPNVILSKLDHSSVLWRNVGWRHLVSKTKWSEQIIIKQSSVDQENYFSPEKIEMFTSKTTDGLKVFRSAKSCLMNYRIGDNENSISRKKVSFCLICESHIRSSLIQMGKLRLDRPFFPLNSFTY